MKKNILIMASIGTILLIGILSFVIVNQIKNNTFNEEQQEEQNREEKPILSPLTEEEAIEIITELYQKENTYMQYQKEEGEEYIIDCFDDETNTKQARYYINKYSRNIRIEYPPKSHGTSSIQ